MKRPPIKVAFFHALVQGRMRHSCVLSFRPLLLFAHTDSGDYFQQPNEQTTNPLSLNTAHCVGFCGGCDIRGIS